MNSSISSYRKASLPEYCTGDYCFGFQSQEIDNEYLSGAVSFKYRVHDSRIGRFLSVDPLSPEYPWNSSYAFSENKVISFVELEGLETFIAIIHSNRENELEIITYNDLYAESHGTMGKGTAYFSRDKDGYYEFIKYATPESQFDVSNIFKVGFGLAESSSEFIKNDWLRGQASGMTGLLGATWQAGDFYNAYLKFQEEKESFFPDGEVMNKSAQEMAKILVEGGVDYIPVPFMGEAVGVILNDSQKEDGITNTENLVDAYSTSNRAIKAYQNEYFNTDHDVSTRQSRIEDRGKEIACDLEQKCE